MADNGRIAGVLSRKIQPEWQITARNGRKRQIMADNGWSKPGTRGRIW
jgi:hypothetical protein